MTGSPHPRPLSRRRAGGALGLVLLIMVATTASAADWRQFRGTDGNPACDDAGVPTSFDVAKGLNVAWRVPLPDRGAASPIVVGNQVIVTCSGGERQDRLSILSFDVGSGKKLWHRRWWATGTTHVHPFSAVAQCTPASDGSRVFAFYSSNDLACFDLDGNLLWYRGLALESPTTRNDVGMASSPLVVGSTVVVQCENQGESFAAGLDVASGRTRWRIPRDHSAIWSSPTLLPGETPREDAVLLVGRDRLTTHDPQTGKLLWTFEAPCHTVASPAVRDGRVYLQANGLNALEPTGRASEPRLLWAQNRMHSGASSPVIHAGRAYVIKSPGILVCGDLADGRVLWQVRLAGTFWSTPVVADGHLWAANDEGLVHVVELGEKGRLLGSYPFDAKVLATPAVADNALYLRGDEHLAKIALTDN
ncbi:MAG: PQQ-binding-like beta-propeller repeat protein [Pirellulales bacterium]|nr:PQQ-binding-like beta-propeller repeat protein [Pirellulales bacterium]